MANGIARLGAVLIFILISSSARASSVSDLLISEIMVNPAAVSDTRGEWFELFNPTTDIIDLDGIWLRDDGSNTYFFDGPLPIAPADYFVLARNADADINGGLTVDHTYSNFSLGNSGDEIVFSDGVDDLLRFNYGPSFDEPGRSRELLNLPMTETNYGITLASLSYGLGDIGTPGKAGTYAMAVSPVPLPSTVWLFLGGLAGFIYRQRHETVRVEETA